MNKFVCNEIYDNYHTREVFDEEGNYLGEVALLDEKGNMIPLRYCICYAYKPSECCCRTTSWDNYKYDDDY